MEQLNNPNSEIFKTVLEKQNQFITIRLNNINTVLYNLKDNFYEDIDVKIANKYIHDSLLIKLLLWEDKLINPNWVENKEWNIVTQMIYEDLMSNSKIRAKSPNDLKSNQL